MTLEQFSAHLKSVLLTVFRRRKLVGFGENYGIILLFFHKTYELLHEKTNFLVPTCSDTNQTVQLQKMARGLKFRIKKVERFYYLCSEKQRR